jgi:DNA mismatch repair protein MSH2
LAYAISEHLAKNVKSFTLFATHFHEITKLADTLNNVKNYHLSSIVENGKLTSLFQVKDGPMLKSFGIEVADIAQLPRSVVDSAKSYLSGLECDEIDNESEEMKKADDILATVEREKKFTADMIESLVV